MKRENIITINNGRVSIPSSGEIWMSQWELADMFECYTAKISANIRAILKTGILNEIAVSRMHHYGNGNSAQLYSLEMITALAFRIKTRNAEIFRNFIMKKAVADSSRRDFLINLLWKKSGMLN